MKSFRFLFRVQFEIWILNWNVSQWAQSPTKRLLAIIKISQFKHNVVVWPINRQPFGTIEHITPLVRSRFVLSFLYTSTDWLIFHFFTSLVPPQNNEVMEKCLHLFKLDYNVVEISNRSGELSSHYPSLIVMPENEKQSSTIPNVNCNFSAFFNQAAATSTNTNSSSTTSSSSTTTSSSGRTQQETIYESSYDATKLKELMGKARFARSRTRFPIPVILYKGKYVCRSSTLSSGPELYTRSSFNYFFNGTAKAPTTTDADACQEGE